MIKFKNLSNKNSIKIKNFKLKIRVKRGVKILRNLSLLIDLRFA